MRGTIKSHLTAQENHLHVLPLPTFTLLLTFTNADVWQRLVFLQLMDARDDDGPNLKVFYGGNSYLKHRTPMVKQSTAAVLRVH